MIKNNLKIIIAIINLLMLCYQSFYLYNLGGAVSHQNFGLGYMHLYEIRPVTYPC